MALISDHHFDPNKRLEDPGLGLWLVFGTFFLWNMVGTAPAEIDLDEDGMSDVWEILYGAEGLAPEGDEDGDRTSNAGEAIAGTDPFDALDYLTVLSVRGVSGGVLMRWPVVPGKSYALFGNRLLRPDGWVPLDSVAPADGADTVTRTLPGDIALDPADLDGSRVGELEKMYFRLDVMERDADADGVSDWEERVLGLDPLRAATANGVPDAMAARARVETPNEVTLMLDRSEIGEAESAVVTVRRAGSFGAIDVALESSGSLVNGTDYEALPMTVHLPRLVDEATLEIRPTGVGFPGATETVTLGVEAAPGYRVGADRTVSLVVVYQSPTAFTANLVPLATAFSPMEATAVLSVAPDRASGELRIALPVPNGTPREARVWRSGASSPWLVVPVARFDGFSMVLTAADITRLEERKVLVEVQMQDGTRMTGRLGLGSAAPVFEPPVEEQWTGPAPGAMSDVEASRFLAQASMGPTDALIADVRAKGFEAWLDEQMALPVSLQVPWMEAREVAGLPLNQGHRVEFWWFNAVWGADTLRQRVAQNLTHLFVVSDRGSDLLQMHFAVADFHDTLAEHAFGNARDLLKAVTRHPAMGIYLSHIRNRKALPGGRTFPDENYAREVMQLFSIGLWKLNPDGSRILGEGGAPVPTYDQRVVEEMARVFTGWSYASDNPNGFWTTPQNETELMTAYEDFHDRGEKRLWDDVVMPAGRSAEVELDAVIDALVRHPNTGPFLCRRFIQRLVTANPSRAYVYRVAEVFRDNGQGVTGDLAAVFKAILLDREARDVSLVSRSHAGFVRTPLLRVVNVLRAFRGAPPSRHFRMVIPTVQFGQGPLQAPSVFNFFGPDYGQPGAVAEAGLVSPVLQLMSSDVTLRMANESNDLAFDRMVSGIEWVDLNTASEEALAGDTEALLDRLDLLLTNGSLSPGTRARVREHLVALDALNGAGAVRGLDKVRAALHLISTSPDFMVVR